MRVKDCGCFFNVNVSANEVDDFKSQWPCSGLPTKAIWFQFDKRNGDLVDIQPANIDGEAVLALSHDAMNYGIDRLSLDIVKR